METSSTLQILVGLLVRTDVGLFVGNVVGLSVTFSVGANIDDLVVGAILLAVALVL